MTERDDDALWRDIVHNYGERARLSEDDDGPDESWAAAMPVTEPMTGPMTEPMTGPLTGPDTDPPLDLGDAFVPPDPPSPPLPTGPRLLAWLGLLVVPVLMLALLLLRWQPPGLVSLALLAWFVGGFGYLVAAMPRGPRDPGDDGARL